MCERIHPLALLSLPIVHITKDPILFYPFTLLLSFSSLCYSLFLSFFLLFLFSFPSPHFFPLFHTSITERNMMNKEEYVSFVSAAGGEDS